MPEYIFVFFFSSLKAKEYEWWYTEFTKKRKAHEEKVVTKHIKIYFMKLYEAIWESF